MLKKMSFIIVGATLLNLYSNYITAQHKVGIAAMYGNRIEQTGLRADGILPIAPLTRIQLNAGIYWPPLDDRFSSRATRTEINTNMQFLLYKGSRLANYFILGMNLTIKDGHEFTSIPYRRTNLAGNIGKGIEYKFNNADFFVEATYIAGKLNQLILGTGFRFRLRWVK